jgi:hypothetical protein
VQYKSQHFVPQCYLRPFSTDANRRSTALYNFRLGRCEGGASIKNQCAKDFFYDRTGATDAVLGGYEGRYAEVVRRLTSDNFNPDEVLPFLRYFSYLQYLRTEAMARQQAAALTEMADFVFENDPEGREWATIDPSTIPRESVASFISTMPYLSGLHDCIVVNQTNSPFITSDNPAVIVNRFHVQRQGNNRGGAGLINSGFMLLLPLSPRALFVSYDHGVYGVELGKRRTVSAQRKRDIEALNALQILKSSENLYFDSEEHADYVMGLVNKYRPLRPAAWYRWSFAVERELQPSSEFQSFGVVSTPAEFRTGNGLMHMQSISVNPGIWCSLFSFRSKPKFWDTKSGAGLVRSPHLMYLRNMMREPSPMVRIPRK